MLGGLSTWGLGVPVEGAGGSSVDLKTLNDAS